MAGFDNLKGTTSDTLFIGKFSNKVYLRSNSGIIEAKNASGIYFPLAKGSFWAKYEVVTPFQTGEILDLVTGTGSISGACIVTGTPANIILPATSGEFDTAANLRIYINGVLAERGVDVVWVSSTSFSLGADFETGEIIEISTPPV